MPGETKMPSRKATGEYRSIDVVCAHGDLNEALRLALSRQEEELAKALWICTELHHFREQRF
jgi:hypothetical protein